MIFVGENSRQKSQNNFSCKFVENRAKILRIIKYLLVPTPMTKRVRWNCSSLNKQNL